MTDDKKILKNGTQEPKSHTDLGGFKSDILPDIAKLFDIKPKAELIFLNEAEIDKIAYFLNLVNALAFSPQTLFYPGKKTNNKNHKYVFMANADKIVSSVQPLGQNADIPEAHVHELTFAGAEFVAKDMVAAHKNNMVIFDECGNTRDRINFLYQLYAGSHTQHNDKTPECVLSEKIFRRFMLYKLELIEAETDTEKQNKMIINFMKHFAFQDRFLAEQYNQFCDVLGHLKKTQNNTAYMKVLLKDGTYANLFELNPENHYQIMHSINVSKIKQPFDFSNMEIMGDFICQNQKKTQLTFPNKINGIFDCSGYSFNIERIPNGATVVNLEYSVQNFADLNQIHFPESVCDLIIKTSIITNILHLLEKENSADDPELVAYRTFIEKHSKIHIMNSGNTPLVLQDELKKLKTKKQTPKITTPEPVVIKQPEIPVYDKNTTDWILRKRLVTLLSSEEQFADVKNLDNIVKQVLASNNLIIRQQKMKYEGNVVACVHTGDIDKVKELLLQFINTPNAAKTQAEKPAVKNTTVPTEQKETKKNKGIKLKKYMPASVYKQIDKACGKNTMLLISVLERIAMINTDYTTLKFDDPLQHIDKKGQVKTIQYTSKHSGASAAMGIEANDNRRIVLTINPNDKIIMVTAFFADHVNNLKNDKQYNDIALPNAAKGYLMDGKTPVTRDLVKSGDYIDIDKKLKEIKEKIVQTVVVTQQKTVTTVIETTTTEVTVVPKPTRTGKRPRINNGKSVVSGTDVPQTLLDVIALEEETYAIVKMLEAKVQEMREKEAPNSVIKKLRNKLMEICRD